MSKSLEKSESSKVKKILKDLPKSPGVYKMIDEDGKVIYVGKAKDLSKRVKQYFRPDYQHSSRTRHLVEKIADIECVAVDSDLEAVIFEHNLIKQLQPKYNVIMKDDKSYVYIKITKEDYPRIQLVRQIEKDGAKYIGPKTAAGKIKDTLKFLKKIFPFRHCNLDIVLEKEGCFDSDSDVGESNQTSGSKKPESSSKDAKVKVSNKVIKYPCLDYFIKRCVGPCIGKCSREEYLEIITDVENFLQGKAEKVVESIEKRMRKLAMEKKFEKAAKMRDRLLKIQDILEKQKVSDPNQVDKDVINYCVSHEQAFFNLFQIRDGKLIGKENFILKAENLSGSGFNDSKITDKSEDSEETYNSKKSNFSSNDEIFEYSQENEEILEAFLRQYYEIATDIPKEILIPHNPENFNEVEDFIESQNSEKYKPKLIVPQKGVKDKLLSMSLNNALIYADRNKTSWQKEDKLTIASSEQLAKVIGKTKLSKWVDIPKKFKRIECYDISHLSGTDTVGSMVVFVNGVPKNEMYRKFKMRTVVGKPDDFKSMEEVLTRRLSKLSEKTKFSEYEFKKVLKKDKEFLESKLFLDSESSGLEDYKKYYSLKKSEEFIGFGKIDEINEKISYINNLWLSRDKKLSLDSQNSGQDVFNFLIKNLVKKAKAKRIYVTVDEAEMEPYLLSGFVVVNKLSKDLEAYLKSKKSFNCLVFDKIKQSEDKSFREIPDLIVIDGGKGQLNAGKKVLERFNLKIPYISLAKRLEEIFVPGETKSIILPRHNEALKLLQKARDEAHRFAISYNRNLREQKFKK